MEGKKKFNWKKLVNAIVVLVVVIAWGTAYITLRNGIFNGSRMFCLAVITFGAFCYWCSVIIDPYLERIEELEEDKIELQSKINRLEMPMTPDECKRKKSSKTKKQ